jgi:Transposase IS66 family
VVVFVLDPSRSHEVPEAHFDSVEEGILVVDRYVAYQVMQWVKDGKILLAFCWAHVRRDFLGVARSWPEEEVWALGWVERIGGLDACNDRRLEAPRGTSRFTACDQELRREVAAMAEQRERELADPGLPPARRKVLESQREHWGGLTVFVDHPEVPMDNDTAERSERGPVVGRKNYSGSGSVWSGELAAILFSLFPTLALWGINPRTWLTAYLSQCAEAGGQAPSEPEALLPWNLSPEQRKVRTDSASFSPAGHLADRASPRRRSAATASSRANEWRLVIPSLSMPPPSLRLPEIALGLISRLNPFGGRESAPSSCDNLSGEYQRCGGGPERHNLSDAVAVRDVKG